MKSVVILGAGHAGSACAAAIQKKIGNGVELTVVDKRTHSVHKIATARAATLGNKYAARALVPNEKLVAPHKGKVVHGEIENVTDNAVELKSGESLNFDYLVCATGATSFSVCEPPLQYGDHEKMMTFFERVSSKIEQAGNIIVVGGGAVGVELAAEIAEVYRDKTISLVHAANRLVSTSVPPPSKGFYRSLNKSLRKLGVKVHLNQKLDIPREEYGNKPYIDKTAEYTTTAGTKIEADLVLFCIGTKLNNSVYPADWKDEKTGQLKVKDTLQLVDHPNIFAIGDINDVKEAKQALWAGAQAVVAAENLKLLVAGRTKLKTYKPSGKTMIVVTAGRREGAAMIGPISMGSWFSRVMKGKELGVKGSWKTYGQGNKAPAEESKAENGSGNPTLEELYAGI